jgi:hypothetical protein
VEVTGSILQKLPHSIPVQLLACIAEGSCGDRRFDRQWHAIQMSLMPEAVEKMLVAASTTISGHVHQERDQ